MSDDRTQGETENGFLYDEEDDRISLNLAHGERITRRSGQGSYLAQRWGVRPFLANRPAEEPGWIVLARLPQIDLNQMIVIARLVFDDPEPQERVVTKPDRHLMSCSEFVESIAHQIEKGSHSQAFLLNLCPLLGSCKQEISGLGDACHDDQSLVHSLRELAKSLPLRVKGS